jgi:hypothetical protein
MTYADYIQIARDWDCDRSHVSRCVNKRGCPTDSLDAAREWREANASKRTSTSPKQIAKLLDEQYNDSRPARERGAECLKDRPDVRPPQSVSIEDALLNARRSAAEAYRVLERAMSEGNISRISALLATHNKALEALFKAEQSHREELERRRILIPIAEANEMARKGYGVVIARLSSLPQNVAPRCNPNNPNQAMGVLEAECAEILGDVRRIYAEVSNTR